MPVNLSPGWAVIESTKESSKVAAVKYRFDQTTGSATMRVMSTHTADHEGESWLNGVEAPFDMVIVVSSSLGCWQLGVGTDALVAPGYFL